MQNKEGRIHIKGYDFEECNNMDVIIQGIQFETEQKETRRHALGA